MINYKRLGVATVMGMILGVFCILGLSQRIPADGALPSNTIYLLGGWYNRVIMGVLIGFAGDLKIIQDKNSPLNAILRGAILGGIVSLGFALFQQFADIPFFIAGFGFGLVNDLITTKLTANKA